MIRIVLNIRPESFQQLLLDRLAQESDFSVVGEASNPWDLLVLVGHASADVVIQTWDSSEPPGVCSHLFAEFPDLVIIGITASPAKVHVCRQVIQQVDLPNPTVPAILSAIRGEDEVTRSAMITGFAGAELWSQHRFGQPNVN